MGYTISRGNTAEPLLFLMVSSADHIAAVTGLVSGSTLAVTISKNGSAFAAPAGVVTEIGDGWYQVAANATDADTAGPLLLHAVGTGADPTDEVLDVQSIAGLAPSIVPTAETTLIAEVRHAVGDWGEYQSHIVPRGVINGTNTRFQSYLFPLGVYETHLFVDDVEITTGFTLDGDTGMLVYSTPPEIGQSHYLEGSTYRYKTAHISLSIDRALRTLATIWGDSKYSSSDQPTGTDKDILMLQASILCLTARQAAVASLGVKIADGAGSTDTTGRSMALRELLIDLRGQLVLKIRDAGYSGLPVMPALDYPEDFRGQVWMSELSGEII